MSGMRYFLLIFAVLAVAGISSLTATASDWPQYGGTDGRWVTNAGDLQYLKDWSKAKLVWTSETAEICPGRGQATRYVFRNAYPKGINPWGGAASPFLVPPMTSYRLLAGLNLQMRTRA